MNATEPKWKGYIPGQGSSHVFLPLRDYLDLRFVCDVIVDFFTKYVANIYSDSSFDKLPSVVIIYFTGKLEYSDLFLKVLCESFEIDSFDAEGVLVRNNGKLRFIDLREKSYELREKTKVMLYQENHITFVNGADYIDDPRPHLVLDFSYDHDREVTKKKPYLFQLNVSSYSLGTSSITDLLSLRRWKSHPAYAPIRAVRGQKKKT